MIKNIVILGSGGLAKEVAYLIKKINKKNKKWNILGFIDFNKKNIGKKINEHTIIGNDEWLLGQTQPISIAFGIGSPKLVKNLYKKFMDNENINYPNLIHPNASGDWDNILLGFGNIICESTIFTTSIQVGNLNFFNLACTVGHDSVIMNYNVINPSVNISGGVELGESILLGTGCQILQNISICSDCIIGAGTVITKDIKQKGVYFGIPAQKRS